MARFLSTSRILLTCPEIRIDQTNCIVIGCFQPGLGENFCRGLLLFRYPSWGLITGRSVTRLQFGTLRASWGFDSAHDGERYEVHLCEPCFFRTLAGLRRERMVNTIFSDGDEDLSDFGRVARDDFLMTEVARSLDIFDGSARG